MNNPLSIRTIVGTAAILALLGVALPVYAQSGTERPRLDGPLTLDQAVEVGLRHSPGIAAMQAEAGAAREETRMARAMTRPQVSANSYLTTGTMSNIVPGSPSIDPAGATIVPPDPAAAQNLTLMVPLYTGGRISGRVRAAGESARAAESDVDTERTETALMIRDAYLRAQLAGEMVRAAESRQTAADEMVRTSRAVFEAGKGIEASVQRAVAEQSDARRMVTSARNDRAKMLLELKAAMGIDLESDVSVADSIPFEAPAQDLKAALDATIQSRPELQAARSRVAAAKAETDATRGAFKPQVYGMAMADAMKQRGMPGESGYTVGVTVGLPLLDGGQRKADTARAQAMQRSAEARLSSLTLQVEREVRQAWLDIETAEQNYRTARESLTAAEASYAVVELRVQNQKSILVEQLDALATATQARANVAQALYDHAIAAARLRRAMGKV